MASKEQTGLYRRVRVWSITLRIFHWSFALACVILILTGLYIHAPFYTGMEYKSQYTMGILRFYHFAAAYVFMSALAVRLYLLFFGNRYERFTDFLPINRRNLRSLFHTMAFYLYLTDRHDCRPGHNALAGTAYFVVLLASILISLSGLYLLYPEVGWIASLGTTIFGSGQVARWVHYILSWFFILFLLFHLYIAIWNDLRSSEGLISGIFSGYKVMPADVEED